MSEKGIYAKTSDFYKCKNYSYEYKREKLSKDCTLKAYEILLTFIQIIKSILILMKYDLKVSLANPGFNRNNF